MAYQPVLKYGYPEAQHYEREYQDFWKTQIDRCVKGYKPPGYSWIPGRYYFYLNFIKMHTAFGGSKRKVLDYPYYRDIDHEYFAKVEEARENQKGLMVLKARRKGMSMNNVGGIGVYEATMQKGCNIGIGCYLENDVEEFRRKFEYLYSYLPKYLVQSRISDNKDEIYYQMMVANQPPFH